MYLVKTTEEDSPTENSTEEAEQMNEAFDDITLNIHQLIGQDARDAEEKKK